MGPAKGIETTAGWDSMVTVLYIEIGWDFETTGDP
jgi:hypothetical protein